MRRILVDAARRKNRIRHGGGRERVPLDDELVAFEESFEDLPTIDQALQRLEETDEQAARLLKLRYFAGLSMEQAAEVLGISTRTAYRTWAYARAWVLNSVGLTD
jgi:RNA polymerase sigma factor (TIGR02999 family)